MEANVTDESERKRKSSGRCTAPQGTGGHMGAPRGHSGTPGTRRRLVSTVTNEDSHVSGHSASP